MFLYHFQEQRPLKQLIAKRNFTLQEPVSRNTNHLKSLISAANLKASLEANKFLTSLVLPCVSTVFKHRKNLS